MKKTKILFLILSLFFITVPFLLFSQNPAGQVIVAKENGDFRSISEAMAAINPDKEHPYIITVMPGVYQEYVEFKSYVTVRGSGSNVTFLESAGNGKPIFFIKELSNVEVSGCTFRNTNWSSGVIKIGGCKDSINIKIENNCFLNNKNIGIFVYDEINYLEIVNNTFNGNSEAISLSSAGYIYIKNNLIYYNGTGIHCQSGSAAYIENNSICYNNNNGINVWDSSIKISYNTIKQNNGDGIEVGRVINSYYSIIEYNYITGNKENDISSIITDVNSPRIKFNTLNNASIYNHDYDAYNLDSRCIPIDL